MSNLYFAGDYKQRIMKLLTDNNTVVELINPQQTNEKLTLEDILLGGEWEIDGKRVSEQGHIFDYNFVDETTDETKTFIFVETDVQKVTDTIFTDFTLYIAIFTHKSLVRLTNMSSPKKGYMKKKGYCGNRIDCLCDAVDRLLNGKDDFGVGDVVPHPLGHMSIYQPNNNFYGKMLKYKVMNYNPGGEDCEC